MQEKKTNSDFLSSGERTGNSPNRSCFGDFGVVGLQCGLIEHRGTGLERPTIEGDSPVFEMFYIPSSILSRAGHVEPCLNLPGPSGKAKYS